MVRDDDCHINSIATIVIWSIVTFACIFQLLYGSIRLYGWLHHRLIINTPSPPSHLRRTKMNQIRMLLKEMPFRLTLTFWLQGLIVLLFAAFHFDAIGPRIGSSWPFTIAYLIACVSHAYPLIELVDHEHTMP
jgi:hypothetical protein